jgi:hypothetical protein
MTSQGDLLCVFERIRHMVLNQYTRYQKDIGIARQHVKFQHRPAVLPFLPLGIHKIVTPPAIELIRQQHLLCKQDRFQTSCTGSFKKTNGLPCSHTLQSLEEIGRPLDLSYFEDDHWHYHRRQGLSIPFATPARLNEHVLEPLVVQGRGRPCRNESSARQDPSAFELHGSTYSYTTSAPDTG